MNLLPKATTSIVTDKFGDAGLNKETIVAVYDWVARRADLLKVCVEKRRRFSFAGAGGKNNAKAVEVCSVRKFHRAFADDSRWFEASDSAEPKRHFGLP